MTPGRFILALWASSAASLSAAPAGPVWNDQVRMPVPGSVHPRLAGREPLGPVPPDQPMERMQMVLKLGRDAGARLRQLLRDQQDPASPSYHQWLTPDQFGAQFGAPQAQLDAVADWLSLEGFTVHGAARGGLSMAFSGTAAQVGKAFRTAIMEYDVDGVRRQGNATGISIPAGLSFVGGVLSLNDLGRRHQHARASRPSPLLDTSAGNALGPGDFATIYNLSPLFTAGTTGTGVTIAVVGQTDLEAQDHPAFISNFNLGGFGGTFTVVHNGADPGILNSDEELEADLDTQWSSAAAPGANVELVVSASSLTTSGVDLSAQYIVDNLLAPVLTLSYGACESDLGPAGNTFYDQLWQQAASEGISVFVASGDSGPAACDDPNSPSGTVKAVSGLASTPFDTSVGGTQFQEGTGSYWMSSTNLFQTTAESYIPEAVWNESGTVPGGSGLWSSGGGASAVYSKPAWQNAAGVPPDGRRDLPDVAFNAAAMHDPYLVFQGGNPFLVGGTSAATPCMAGIMALVVQKYGPQGNANFTLYGLAKAQYAGTGPAVFHDITTGNDNVPGVTGFTAGTGYDQATGLGSLDAAALVTNWSPAANPITVSVAPATATVASRQSLPFSGSAVDSGGAALTYTWNFGDGASASGASATHTYVINGAASQTFRATLTASDGLYAQSGVEMVTVTPAGVSPSITLPVTNVGVLPGISIGFTAGTATTQNAGATVTGYAWNFGDGTGASGMTASHVFQQQTNPYTVTLTATDSTGASGTASLTLLADLASVMDVNGDGVVDVRDLLVISAAWGTQATAANFNGVNLAADMNGDGLVNDTDLNLWIAHFAPVAP